MCYILVQYSGVPLTDRGAEEDEDSDSDEETDDLEPPKVLGDLLESLAGAIFMDSGMDLQAVWTTFEPLFTEKIGMCEEVWYVRKNISFLMHTLCVIMFALDFLTLCRVAPHEY